MRGEGNSLRGEGKEGEDFFADKMSRVGKKKGKVEQVSNDVSSERERERDVSSERVKSIDTCCSTGVVNHYDFN